MKPPRSAASLVGWLSVAQLITWGSLFYTFALLIEPVERELGLSRTQSSLAFSLALLTEGLLAYPIGRWIDRGLERRVMCGGSLLAAALLATLALVRDALAFQLVWAALGVAMAATLYNTAFAVLTRRFPRDFRRAIIGLTFLGGLASTVFIPLSAGLIGLWGWRATVLVLAALQLLVCAPLHAWVLRGAAQAVAPHADAPAADPIGLAGHLRSPVYLLISAFVILMMMVTSALPPHLVSLLRESGMPELWAVAIPASIGLFQVFGRLLLYFFEHRFDLHQANRLIPGLVPLGLAALLLAPWLGPLQSALAWTFVLFYGIGNGMLTIVKGTAMAEYVSRAHVAALNGALGLPLALARAAAPLLLGALWTRERGYAAGLWLLLGAAVLALLALLLAQRRALHRSPGDGTA